MAAEVSPSIPPDQSNLMLAVGDRPLDTAAVVRASRGDVTIELAAAVARIEAQSRRVETPCGDGSLVWRVWGSGPPLVLLHGGYGSWMHWVRNVIPLSRRFTVIACDMPGLGESATPPEPSTADGLAAIVVRGLDIVLPKGVAPHLAGFSFGGVIGGVVAAQLGDRLKAFTVVGLPLGSRAI